MRTLKDEKNGLNIDYDLPLPVFSPASDSGILEQLVLSLYFRGGDEVIDRPYVVRLIEQPLAKFFINQMCLWKIYNQDLDSWDKTAQYLASENVLLMPNILSGKALEHKKNMTKLRSIIWDKRSSNETRDKKDIREIADLLEETIIPCTMFRIPAIISLLHDFQEAYKKPDDPNLAAILDMYRRIVDKSLQETLNSSKNTISKLIEKSEENPSLRNVRLADVFARQQVSLGFKENLSELYDRIRDLYFMCLNSTDSIEDKISSYASLITFDKLLGDEDSAMRHLFEVSSIDISHSKNQTGYLRLEEFKKLFSSDVVPSQIDGETRLYLTGFAEKYHPGLLKIIYNRLIEYHKINGDEQNVTYPVDLIERMLKYAKLTKLNDIYYQEDTAGNNYRCFVFNQRPFIHVVDEAGAEDHAQKYVIRQKISSDYFSALDRIFEPLRKMKVKGKLFRTPDLSVFLESDVDRYLFKVPEIRRDERSPGSTMTAILPTKPKLMRRGPNGDGPIETEKYTETQKS